MRELEGRSYPPLLLHHINMRRRTNLGSPFRGRKIGVPLILKTSKQKSKEYLMS